MSLIIPVKPTMASPEDFWIYTTEIWKPILGEEQKFHKALVQLQKMWNVIHIFQLVHLKKKKGNTPLLLDRNRRGGTGNN